MDPAGFKIQGDVLGRANEIQGTSLWDWEEPVGHERGWPRVPGMRSRDVGTTRGAEHGKLLGNHRKLPGVGSQG